MKAWNQFVAIVRKELLEASRSGLWPIALALGLSVAQQIIVHGRVNRGEDASNVAQVLALGLLAPLVIPIIGNRLVARGLLRERLTGVMVPLLTTPAPPALLWAGKVVAAFLASYAVFAGCWLLTLLGRALMLGDSTLSVAALCVAWALGPAMALGVLTVAATLYWVFRLSERPVSWLVLVAVMGTWRAGRLALVDAKSLAIASVAVTGGVLLVIGACTVLVVSMSREKLGRP